MSKVSLVLFSGTASRARASAGDPGLVLSSEQHGERRGAAVVHADDARRGSVGVEPEVRQPVEQRADPDLHLGTCDVYAETHVGSPAEPERCLWRAPDVELV